MKLLSTSFITSGWPLLLCLVGLWAPVANAQSPNPTNFWYEFIYDPGYDYSSNLGIFYGLPQSDIWSKIQDAQGIAHILQSINAALESLSRADPDFFIDTLEIQQNILECSLDSYETLTNYLPQVVKWIKDVSDYQRLSYQYETLGQFPLLGSMDASLKQLLTLIQTQSEILVDVNETIYGGGGQYDPDAGGINDIDEKTSSADDRADGDVGDLTGKIGDSNLENDPISDLGGVPTAAIEVGWDTLFPDLGEQLPQLGEGDPTWVIWPAFTIAGHEVPQLDFPTEILFQFENLAYPVFGCIWSAFWLVMTWRLASSEYRFYTSNGLVD